MPFVGPTGGQSDPAVLNYKIREGWDQMMRPVGLWLGHSGFEANAITVFGVVMQALVAYLIVEGRLLLAGFVALAGALADALDGAVAKSTGMSTKFGALLDSTADRLSYALFFLPVAWLFFVFPDLS